MKFTRSLRVLLMLVGVSLLPATKPAAAAEECGGPGSVGWCGGWSFRCANYDHEVWCGSDIFTSCFKGCETGGCYATAMCQLQE
jgi:hypothetical protein